MKTTNALLLLLALTTSLLAQGQENPAKLKLARDVIVASQADKTFERIKDTMQQVFASESAKAAPNATSEQRQKSEAIQAKVMEITMNFCKDLTSQLDHIYADIYTEAELKEMKAFFTSAGGQAMIEKQPSILKRLMPLIQERQKDIQSQMNKVIEDNK